MNDLAHRLFSTRVHPQIQYLVIPKCGCTFVKNLLWRIDHQHDHTNPIRVHDDDSVFPRASDFGFEEEQIRQNEYAFTIFRNPVDRFLSLYFDKVAGPGHLRFAPLREVLIKYYQLYPDPVTPREHWRNCMILLDWLEMNLHGESELPHDPHWTPQGWRMDVIKKFDLKILMLAGSEQKLKNLLRPLVPNIDGLVDGIERNRSSKPVSRGEIVDAELDKRVSEVYGHDRWLTHQAWQFWETHKPVYPEEFPRISDILPQNSGS